MAILVTGCAGFIGMHTSLRLLKRGFNVVGLDNLNNYYGVQLKSDRLSILLKYKNFTFIKENVQNLEKIQGVLEPLKIIKIIHLAAQAGVRYSIENPDIYLESNIKGFLSVMEFSKNCKIDHVIYASSSSVYGLTDKNIFNESDITETPISFYAVTKKANELMAHYYSTAFSLRLTGLRFFTAYGPWGRPDMAPAIFTESIMSGKSIKIFNNGKMSRDFTYIDDIVDGILQIVDYKPREQDNKNEVLNIGNGYSVKILEFIKILESKLNKKAVIEFAPLQLGDVRNTFSSIKRASEKYKFSPHVSVSEGLEEYIKWYLSYAKG